MSKKHIYLYVTTVLFVGGLLNTAFARLDSSLRLKALPLLIPNDPENYLLDQLPEYPLEATAKLEANFESKRNNPAFEEVTWQGLAINFLLQQKYLKAIQCLEYANNYAEEEELPYYLAFKAYAMQQIGRIDDAEFIWKQQINEQEDNRPVLTQLIACEIIKRRLLAAKTLVDDLPEDRKNESITQYLKAIMALSSGDLFEAQAQLLHIIREPGHPQEVYLALAISSLERGGEYDVVGWLKKSFQTTTPYQRHLIANHPAFSPLQKHPAFIELLNEFSVQLKGESDLLSPPLLVAYQKKYSIPETLRVHLALRLQKATTPPQFQGLRLIEKKQE